ncbi:MAG: 2-phospho-L-lactate transferase [Methanosaeta sp. PtaB.Bin018]|nr:2-phospho-L-lactate transferase [Methanothrix sp.]OPX74797.1 MAG: 2-phospho-L-lactate transferase [Methanosaeta sp. PtaB.Bin018]OPY47984.1 MAG: 2-phospho-L-lactate transferase [Methanosaeta sp. PtaU1.Bin016]
MIVASGGTGTPKLLLGLKEQLEPDELSVVVNTAEDMWISGNLVTPDLDTVLYTLAGIVDEQRWWGIAGDSFLTHEFLHSLGRPELLALGDRDRAVQIFRSDLMRQGESLSDATQHLAQALGVKQRVVPMTDDPVSTMISTPSGEMHFQDYWVGLKGNLPVHSLRLKGIDKARPSPGFLHLLKEEKVVLLGPSNPVTSIGPILALPGVRERLSGKKIVAMSPLVGGQPVSGPAADFMRACGVPASDDGVLSLYGKVDLFIVDKKSRYRGECARLDTLMRSKEDSIRLARDLLELISCS